MTENITLNGVAVQSKQNIITFPVTVNEVFNIQCLIKDNTTLGGIMTPNALNINLTGFDLRLDAYGEGTSVPNGTADTYYLLIGIA